MMAFNRHLLFQGLIFRFHVKLQGFAIKHDIMISWQLFRQQNIMKSSYSGIGCLIVYDPSRYWRSNKGLCVTWAKKNIWLAPFCQKNIRWRERYTIEVNTLSANVLWWFAITSDSFYQAKTLRTNQLAAMLFVSHRIHVWYISPYIYHKFMPNVCKYSIVPWILWVWPRFCIKCIPSRDSCNSQDLETLSG